MLECNLPYPEIIAKNLFIRDDKKRNYYLIMVQEDKKSNLKKFQEQFDTRKLSFVSENDLMSILGLVKDSITLFGLLNNEEYKVQFYIGKKFSDVKLGIHQLENTAIIWISGKDLIKIINEYENQIVEF